VSTYFRPEKLAEDGAARPEYAARFRGRALRGRDLVLPGDYEGPPQGPRTKGVGDHDLTRVVDASRCGSTPGVILREAAARTTEEDGEMRQWRVEAPIERICAWGHDAAPHDGHPLVRLVDWLGIADALHGPSGGEGPAPAENGASTASPSKRARRSPTKAVSPAKAASPSKAASPGSARKRA